MITVKNLVKSYALLNKTRPFDIICGNFQKIVVLDDISFSVDKGHLLGVMGQNGAGKSTLLRVLGGIYSYDSGIVAIRGEIAAIFEMGAFLNIYQTGREYCQEYLYFMAAEDIDTKQTIDDIEEFTELGSFFDRPIHTYSSGMNAKLLFALATALPSEIFLIDEIMVVGDEYFQGKAWKRMREMLLQGTSGVLVTHDWTAVLKLCERGLLLENKKSSFLGSAQEMVRRYLLGDNPEDTDSKEITILDKDKLQSIKLICNSGEDLSFSFDINVCEPPPDELLATYFYVEMFVFGYGWSRVLTFHQTQHITQPGIYEILVSVPNLPLAPGEYAVGIEVARPYIAGTNIPTTIYARMNWLTNSPLTLVVPGSNQVKSVLTDKGRLQWNINNT